MAKRNETIRLFDPQKDIIRAKVTIQGDTPLILSKLTRGTAQALSDVQTGAATKGRKNINMYEEVIERITWLKNLPPVDEMQYTQEELEDLQKNNCPCILGEAIQKAVAATVVRCGYDTYSTSLKATFRVTDEKVPIKYSKMEIDGRIIPAKRGAPILTYKPVFYDWSAAFNIMFTTDIYSAEQIFAFINQAGFSNGLGCHRPGTNGANGMFHIVPNED